jgi:hypothetical protein
LEVRNKVSSLEENWVSSVNRRLEGLEARVCSLEQGLLYPKKTRTVISGGSKGPTNAMLKLAEGGFMDTPKAVKEVQEELNRQGYYYSIQITDSALRRMNKSKVLTRTGKRGHWEYAVRK